MLSRNWIQLIVFLSLLIFWVGTLLSDASTGSLMLKVNSAAVTLIYLVLLTFDKWLWKQPLINRWVSKPHIEGTWKGTFDSSYIYEDTGKTKGPVEAYFSIRQTYSSTHIRFITRESTSDSTTCEIKQNSSGRYELSAVYVNTPTAGVRDRSAIHYGGLILSIIGNIEALEGRYWTDRKTTGDLTFDKRSKKIVDNFHGASQENYN